MRRDRLAVRDLDLFGLDLDAELAAELLEGDGQVGLAHAAEQRLFGLVVALHAQGRVLFEEAAQGVGQLVFVGLASLAMMAIASTGSGRLDCGAVVTGLFFGASVSPGRGVVQLGHGADVAGRQLGRPARISLPDIVGDLGEALVLRRSAELVQAASRA